MASTAAVLYCGLRQLFARLVKYPGWARFNFLGIDSLAIYLTLVTDVKPINHRMRFHQLR
jgi:hypothetical protein